MEFVPLSDRSSSATQFNLYPRHDLFLMMLFSYVLVSYQDSLVSLTVPLLALVRLRKGKETVFPAAGLAIILAVVSLVLAHEKPTRELKGCKTNLKHLATALEMYSCDHQGHYPKSLAELVPQYVISLPKCPAAGVDTYSCGLATASQPAMFTVHCKGNFHKDAQQPTNCPQYFNCSHGMERQCRPEAMRSAHYCYWSPSRWPLVRCQGSNHIGPESGNLHHNHRLGSCDRD